MAHFSGQVATVRSRRVVRKIPLHSDRRSIPASRVLADAGVVVIVARMRSARGLIILLRLAAVLVRLHGLALRIPVLGRKRPRVGFVFVRKAAQRRGCGRRLRLKAAGFGAQGSRILLKLQAWRPRPCLRPAPERPSRCAHWQAAPPRPPPRLHWRCASLPRTMR